MIELKGRFGNAQVMIDTVEEDCISQIQGFLNHPLYCNPVRIMPDTHGGKGSVIGFTMKLTHGVCANVIGVDIGCGVNCWQIVDGQTLSFPDIDTAIRRRVPLGMTTHSKPIATIADDYDFGKAQKNASNFINAINKRSRDYDTKYPIPTIDYEWFLNLCKTANVNEDQVNASLGTLGGGNHYVEIGVGKDTNQQVHHYLTVHSGSRNFGKRVADYYQKLAQGLTYNRGFDRDLAYLIDQNAMDYYMAMIFVQEFASMNRAVIGELIRIAGDLELGDCIESIHNYIDFRDMIIRKGAISSYVGEKMVIPFNMKDGMWICEGKSNPGWNFSAPHGAGRIMSRTQAKKTIVLEDFQKEMEGIFSTSVGPQTLDEAPGTYKPAELIQQAIGPTATILTKVRPVYNLKA